MGKTSSYRDALLESLADPVEAKHYLRAVLEDNPDGFLKALRNVAQANEMKKVADAAGIKRESLYRVLSDNGNPTLETLRSVLGALGLRISIESVEEAGMVESDTGKHTIGFSDNATTWEQPLVAR